MAPDPAGQRVLLFGGRSGGQATDGTWAFQNRRWTRLEPAVSPPAIAGGAMATDPNRQTVILHLGPGQTWEWGPNANWVRHDAGGPRLLEAAAVDAARGVMVMFDGAATHEWDGSRWQVRTTANRPPAAAVFNQGLAYDAARGVIVLHHGSAPETWSYDGVDWTRATPANLPPAADTELVYDPVRQRTVLRAGNETWGFDGTDWTRIAGASGSSRSRRGHALAFDPSRGEVILFGGEDQLAPQAFSETLALTGSAWQVITRQGPEPRSGAASTYDSVQGGVLLSGGSQGGLFTFNDLWRFDGRDWQQLPSLPGLPRRSHAMAFDSRRNQVIVFGGGDVPGPGFDDTTWLFDGLWRAVPPVPGLGPRTDLSMSYDPVRDRTVLFGGNDIFGAGVNDQTWEWDGTTWTQRQPANRPPAGAVLQALTWDASRQTTALLIRGELWEWGGIDWRRRNTVGSPTGSLHFDTERNRLIAASNVVQELIGNTWVRRSTTLAPRTADAAQGFDAGRGRLVCFGGDANPETDQTWEYAPVDPARMDFGAAGCAGTSGIPRIDAVPGRGPWIGDTLVLEVDRLPNTPQTVLTWIGFSDTQWENRSLPFALDALGMPGCALHASVNATFAATAAAGRALLALPVPAERALLGRQAWFQALVPDPPSNALGAVVSNSTRATFGSK